MQKGIRTTGAFVLGDSVYRVLARCSQWIGVWIVRLFAFVIAGWYYVFLPRRLGHSVRLYRALFPERGRWHAFVCAWRQYQDFANVYAERLELDRDPGAVRIDRDGEHWLYEARSNGRGAVLLMSHFGRWELAARMLGREASGLTILMGVPRGATQAQEPVSSELRKNGVNVHAVPQGQGQPVDVFEAVRALREGQFVSLAADRAPEGSRVVRLPLLGGEVAVNLAPFVLALSTGAPLFVVFAYRLGPRRYRFVCSPPRFVRAASREERDTALRAAAQAYLDDLLRLMREYPEQWQTFGPFLLP